MLILVIIRHPLSLALRSSMELPLSVILMNFEAIPGFEEEIFFEITQNQLQTSWSTSSTFQNNHLLAQLLLEAEI